MFKCMCQNLLYQKQVVFLQKGGSLEALILLGISPGTACYSVPTEEEQAARHAAERCMRFLLQMLQSGFFFCMSRS